jgi:hypothetical protein
MLEKPVSTYVNWAAYDELSDNVELTEALAMRQLSEMIRLRCAGVQFDYYLMDAFWYAADGGYRAWRQPHWPEGPDRWLDACLASGIKPGLWFSGNTLCKLSPVPEWKESLDAAGDGMCLFHGGFLPHWLETMHLWYERGVRAFKLDFLSFRAAPAALQRTLLPSEIYAQNVAALRNGLSVLRQRCPELLLLGYNGFEEAETQQRTDSSFRKTVDVRWLDVLDSLYCGDPRPSDVPAMNFWRSKDIYSDHMVRVYEQNGFPLQRVDNAGFMIGTTGTCYHRKTAAWQGMLILSLARGGWVNTYYGNLELLTDEQAHWFAKVQSLFLGLQVHGRSSTFGATPGQGLPYGYVAREAAGAVFTVVNPSQSESIIPLPGCVDGRLLFCDAGYMPKLRDGELTLGAEQMAVVGTGCYNSSAYDLGRQIDVVIPVSITVCPASFQSVTDKRISTTVSAPRHGALRVILRQKDKAGRAKRSAGGAPPAGKTLGRILTIAAEQAGQPVPVLVNYDKAIWSGLSWAVGEILAQGLDPNLPVTIVCSTTDTADVALTGELHHVEYPSREGNGIHAGSLRHP